MNTFFEIFNWQFHLLFLASANIGTGFGKFAKLRLAGGIWTGTLWFKFLIVEEGLFFSAQIGIAIFSSIAYSWWFGLIILIEQLLVGGLILGVIQGTLKLTYGSYRWVSIKTIGVIVDAFLFVFYINNLEYSVDLFGISFPFWVFMLAFALPRGIFGIITFITDLLTGNKY